MVYLFQIRHMKHIHTMKPLFWQRKWTRQICQLKVTAYNYFFTAEWRLGFDVQHTEVVNLEFFTVSNK